MWSSVPLGHSKGSKGLWEAGDPGLHLHLCGLRRPQGGDVHGRGAGHGLPSGWCRGCDLRLERDRRHVVKAVSVGFRSSGGMAGLEEVLERNHLSDLMKTIRAPSDSEYPWTGLGLY